jgi:hypothetical protein
MLFKETAAVYCENHTEHTNPVRISLETYYVSAAQTNRLIMFKKTVALYCDSHTEHTNTRCGLNYNFLRLKQVVHVVTMTC